ncbi:MoaD/ThiS family protein [Azospirillum thermophilum]|uniref:Thiamine biosynthesis protein ThiS n=1 Tax=Azospirillum thermophilum TaxID=2202148 RepID=A0A2S2CPD5_9PROT|nr:MoaD/ThiS family protein [Azospirillum thermophilum]AWK86384.1 thiamine biosynthesis protein ThiS [Azospirillum thermophilum]
MSEVTVRIPTPLRGFIGGRDRVTVGGTTVREALAALTDGRETLRDRLFNADGELHRFVNVYLGQEDVRRLGGLDAAVPAGATLTVLVALAGG